MVAKPAPRTWSVFPPAFVLLGPGDGGAGTGEEVGSLLRRNLPNIVDFSFSFSFSFGGSSLTAFSFPLLGLAVMVPYSSTGGGGSFLDLVAVRKVCPRDKRMRWCNGTSSDPGRLERFEDVEGCCEREDDAAAGGREPLTVMR